MTSGDLRQRRVIAPQAQESPSYNNKLDDLPASSSSDSMLSVSPVYEFYSNARRVVSGEAVKKEESKVKKIVVRVALGACMFGLFSGSVRIVGRENPQAKIPLLMYRLMAADFHGSFVHQRAGGRR